MACLEITRSCRLFRVGNHGAPAGALDCSDLSGRVDSWRAGPRWEWGYKRAKGHPLPEGGEPPNGTRPSLPEPRGRPRVVENVEFYLNQTEGCGPERSFPGLCVPEKRGFQHRFLSCRNKTSNESGMRSFEVSNERAARARPARPAWPLHPGRESRHPGSTSTSIPGG